MQFSLKSSFIVFTIAIIGIFFAGVFTKNYYSAEKKIRRLGGPYTTFHKGHLIVRRSLDDADFRRLIKIACEFREPISLSIMSEDLTEVAFEHARQGRNIRNLELVKMNLSSVDFDSLDGARGLQVVKLTGCVITKQELERLRKRHFTFDLETGLYFD